MSINRERVRESLKSFSFNKLFREQLGWDNHNAELEVEVQGCTYKLTAIAHKRGLVAYLLASIPDRETRVKINRKAFKYTREHFIVYADQASGKQVWHWGRRELGKPLANRERYYDIKQSGEPLIQSLEQIAVGIDEEEKFTLTDMTGRVRAAFDSEKVTKKFYDRFKVEHLALCGMISGIHDAADREWYTSLMLNRLMFIYFIQKKGFLDGDTDYLRNRLEMVRSIIGKGKYQSFYRYFLLRLFHDGLGKSPDERQFNPTMERLIGKVPFLNGGYFEIHQIEEKEPDIDIPDEAFERIFRFFDEYSWHLDDRPLRNDKEINPDVIGYVFEKYINRKQMGAYYTKEDITEYISKNTIIPYIFDAAKKKCEIAFEKDSALWRLLRDDPDRYIYESVRNGVIDKTGNIIPMPSEIEEGINDVSKRGNWNRSASDPYGLPTETWREYVARRQRCIDTREKLRNGEVHQINDLITLNLDIWQFARDAIVNAEGPELLRAFWKAINSISILDPTCGSGAFLYAALRIMETLYSDCLERMRHFLEDISDKPHHPQKYDDFSKTVAQIKSHPSESYFIVKYIIINNLYGVDIMDEAVEICKLRLFLKLIAQVEEVDKIEPLPDVDFNIRAGNALVGYCYIKDINKVVVEDESGQKPIVFDKTEEKIRHINDEAIIIDKTFQQFKIQQAESGGKVMREVKRELRARISAISIILDEFYAGEYKITRENFDNNNNYHSAYSQWQSSHKPFHWCIEFYGIMAAGGFSVIIGNPPYVEYKKVKKYTVRGYKTEECGNLYAFILERSLDLLHKHSNISMIIPLSSFSTMRMKQLQDLYENNAETLFLSYYEATSNPTILFVGVKIQLTILIANKSAGKKSRIFVTNYRRAFAEERQYMFELTTYCPAVKINDRLARISNTLEDHLLKKIFMPSQTLAEIIDVPSRTTIWYRNMGNFFFKLAFLKEPMYEKNGFKEKSSTVSELGVTDETYARLIVATINSTLFYYYWVIISDCYHLSKGVIASFPLPINNLSAAHTAQLYGLCERLLVKLEQYSVLQCETKSDGTQKCYKKYFPQPCKSIIDEIDSVLAEQYKFTSEELDFITNYDIKYRMGADVEEGDE